MTGTKIKQIKSRLIAGKIMEMLDKKGMLNRVEHIGMENWNGKNVMVNKLTGMTPEEQEQLEQEINEQVNLVI
jgi:hypothetical protein